MYFVKITAEPTAWNDNAKADTRYIEYAGLHGVRSVNPRPVNGKGFVTMSGVDKIIKHRKLEGWKTLRGAAKYIKAEQAEDARCPMRVENWNKTYEVVMM